MRTFLKSLSSLVFDEEKVITISTKPLITKRNFISIYSGSALTPEISHLILRAKEDNDLMARRFLARLIVDAISLISRPQISVIMVPSRIEASRSRGIKHINELVKEVNKLHPIKTYDVLHHTRKVRDQSSLNQSERATNLAGAFEITESRNIELPRDAFLIDDLVTTGATISAAAMAVVASKVNLLGVICASSTVVFSE